ncbi:MAG: DUF1667 domain-containing protein [Bacilli bacterium]|jgi:CxxC motif-containing protein|nr:DUF1667 domain-containing protein [Bacilli bacterium]
MSEFICIVCPRGCRLQVDKNNKVTGNFCKRGEVYGIQEATNPTRVVTSTVRITNSELVRLPVMTSRPIPKNKIFAVMEAIQNITVPAPVQMREVILENVCDLGVNIIATRNAPLKEEV